MPGQGVDQRTGIITVPRMDDHAGGFVDDQQVVVLIDDVQGDVLRQDLIAAAPVGHHELDHIAGTDDEIGLRDLAVDAHIPLLDGRLDAVAGGLFKMRGHVFVHTHRSLAWIDAEAEMLEHSLLFVTGGFFDDGAVVSDGTDLQIFVGIDLLHQFPPTTWPTLATFSGSMLSARVTSEPMRIGIREAAGDWFRTTALSESE